MLAFGDRGASRRSLYSGTGSQRLSPPWRAIAAAAALCAGFAGSGCAYQLDSLSGKGGADPLQTGSVGRRSDADPASTQPSDGDLASARAAAAAGIGDAAEAASIPWQNPQTGAAGNITPLPTAYTEGGRRCRDFLVSYVRAESQLWLEGAACRAGQRKWEVKSLRALKPS